METTLVPEQATLMTVIERLASNPNADIGKIQLLLEMQERWELNRDKAALRHAMAEFKKNPPAIIKQRVANIKSDKGSYSYTYADLENVTSAIESELAKLGVIFAWPQKDDTASVTVTCVLRLGQYEEEGVTMSGPVDQSGGKNALQARASTVTYLRRYTLLGAVGMAAGMPDTDAASLSGLDEGEYASHLTLIQGSSSLDELKRFYLAAVKAAKASKDLGAEKDYLKAKDERKKALEAAHAGH